MTFEELDKQREKQGIPKDAKIRLTRGILGFQWETEEEHGGIPFETLAHAYITLPQNYDSE